MFVRVLFLRCGVVSVSEGCKGVRVGMGLMILMLPKP